MATLDFSEAKPTTDDVTSADIQSLVDKSSLGTRNKDGLYELKDWDFSKDASAVDSAIADALKPISSKTPAGGALGTFTSLFSRLTGSKTLTDADLRPVLDAMKQHLMKKNVAMEIAEKVCEGVGETLVGQKIGGFQSM